tara:strand:- start:694 stop:1401 length:708 start_codon:yes stop_codon:yes gene_type:complete
MALPKLQTPTYELVLPSTNEKIKYRPFLVKEQKILLMSQESGQEDDIANAVGNLVKSCTFDKIDPSKSPLFDIEYVFLQIRAKSVGETSEIMVTCPDDNKTKVPIKLNLQDISVQMTAEHTNEIILSDSIKLYLRYPLLNDVKGILTVQSNASVVFSILNNCVQEIHHNDKIYHRVDINDDELNEFIDSLTNNQLDSIMKFFDSMPKLRHVIKVTNPNTKVKGEVVLEGLSNFLE